MIGLTYDYRFGAFSLQSGLALNFIEGNQQEALPVTILPTYEEGQVISEKNIDVYYLGIPILFNHHVGRVSYGGGIRASYRLTNGARSKTYSEPDFIGIGGDVQSLFYQTGNNLSTLDLGVQGRIGVDITDHFNLEGMLYQGLTDIGNGFDQGVHSDIGFETFDFTERLLKTRQFTLGVKYTL